MKKTLKLVNKAGKLIDLLIEDGIELRAHEVDGFLLLGIEKRDGLLTLMIDEENEFYEMQAFYIDIHHEEQRHYLIGESINRNAVTTFVEIKKIIQGLDQAEKTIDYVKKQAEKVCSM
ncbi:hypothetical protein IAE23_25870 [Bacillus sp. S35]|nr:hypothetical protein [Bacillus sp. S35]